MNDPKETNPKDAVGVRKVPFSVIPWGVIARIGLALLEGARKYGRHNWRDASARASTYFDGTVRHLVNWYEGTDIDPDSGLNHIDKALASLTVLRDAMLAGRFVDDRPPVVYHTGWMQAENVGAGNIIDKYPDAKEPHTQANRRSQAKEDPIDGVSRDPKKTEFHTGAERMQQFMLGNYASDVQARTCPQNGGECKLLQCGNGKCWARDTRPRIDVV